MQGCCLKFNYLYGQQVERNFLVIDKQCEPKKITGNLRFTGNKEIVGFLLWAAANIGGSYYCQQAALKGRVNRGPSTFASGQPRISGIGHCLKGEKIIDQSKAWLRLSSVISNTPN